MAIIQRKVGRKRIWPDRSRELIGEWALAAAKAAESRSLEQI